jgi:hypothetical protein
MEPGPAPSFAAHLERARAARFAGRGAELARLRAALADPAPSTWFVHGPGGIGKTALLEQLAADARAAGAAPAWIDARGLGRDAGQVAAALAAATGAAPGTPPGEAFAGRPLLFVDSFEAIAGLELWLRRDLLPSLPGAPVVIIAGRQPPSPAWRADPAWQGTLHGLELGALAADESADLLARRGVPADARDALYRQAHGHPLALAMLAEVPTERRSATAPGDLPGLPPDLVSVLVERFVQDVPDGDHQRALDLCALARVTTEALLRDVVGGDPGALHRWLRSLAVVEQGPAGLVPHDLAREVIGRDLALRDPDGHRALADRLRAHHLAALERATDDDGRQRAVRDLLYSARRQRAVGRYFTWRDGDVGWGELARPADREPVLALLADHEAAGAEVAAHWWQRQRSAFTVYRAPTGELAGLLVLLQLDGLIRRDRDADPAIDAAARHVERAGPLRPGDVVCYTRFFGARGAWHEVSPVQDLVQATCTMRWLTTPALAWSFVAVEAGSPWSAQLAAIDMPASADASFALGETAHTVHVHDWRRVPPARWLARSGAEAAPAPVPAMTDAALAEAITAALREAARAGGLVESPLLTTAAVRGLAAGARPGPDAIRALLRGVVDELGRHPRDAKAAAAIDATYLRPAPTQEAAAERLGLPMGTYRRHLRRGIARVIAIVTERERAARGG